MAGRSDEARRLLRQVNTALIIAKKDARIYYLKPPVVSFGIVFPLFFYLAFAAGHPMAPNAMVPGVVAMALFFTASAVGPLITPWERQARTYERLVVSPASLGAILAGDTLAGAAFGALLSAVPIVLGVAATSAAIAAPLPLAAGILLGAAAFAALGVLMASPNTETPSQIMMVSNLVRLPLIFISGIFIPLREAPAWGRWLAPLSPLSYAADLVRLGFGQEAYFGPRLDVVALALFTISFLALARWLLGRARR
jgi:ABC-2 type transport system permease protein